VGGAICSRSRFALWRLLRHVGLSPQARPADGRALVTHKQRGPEWRPRKLATWPALSVGSEPPLIGCLQAVLGGGGEALEVGARAKLNQVGRRQQLNDVRSILRGRQAHFSLTDWLAPIGPNVTEIDFAGIGGPSVIIIATLGSPISWPGGPPLLACICIGHKTTLSG